MTASTASPEEIGAYLRKRYAAAIASATRAELRTIVDEFKTSWRKNLKVALIGAAIAFVVGWAVYAAFLAVHYDGYNVPPGSAVPGKGNTVTGSIFAFGLSFLISAAIGYRLRGGKGQLAKSVRQWPARLRATMAADGSRATSDLLWGAAGGLIATSVLAKLASLLPLGNLIGALATPGVSAVLAGFVAVVVGTALRRTAGGVLMVVWQRAANRFAPEHRPPLPATFEVALLGVGAAFVISYLVHGSNARMLLALAAAGAAVLIRRSGAPGSAAAVVLVAVLVLVLLSESPTAVLADDGGYKECGSRGLAFWLSNCGGAALVLKWGLVGGLTSFFGSLTGIPAGMLIPGLFDEFGRHGPLEEPVENECLGGCDGNQLLNTGRDQWNQWRKRNPDAPLDDSWYVTNLFKSLYSDVTSGDMIVRTETMGRNMPDAMMQLLYNEGMPIGKSMIDAKAYFDSGQSDRDWNKFWDRPKSEVHRDVLGFMDSFRTGTDPITRGVEGTIEQKIADFRQFKGEYMDAFNRGDQVALGNLHAQGTARFGFDVMTTIGPEVAARGGVGLTRTGIRTIEMTGAAKGELVIDFSHMKADKIMPGSNLPEVIRTRAQIEAAMEESLRLAKPGETVSLKLTPAEAERFNVSKRTVMNLWETNLQNGTMQEFKLGPEYGPAARRAGDSAFKPNSMGAKSLTPEEAHALKIDPKKVGDVYHYTPETLPDPSSPAYKKMLFRQQNAGALQEEMTKLSTKGGTGIDTMGREYHYTTRIENDGRVMLDTRNGVKVEGDVPFRIDEDTFNWGSTGDRTIRIPGEKPGEYKDLVIKGRNIPEDVQQRLIYQQSDVAGEGQTVKWRIEPDDPKYAGDPTHYQLDVNKKATTLAAIAEEGSITLDADGVRFCKTKLKK